MTDDFYIRLLSKVGDRIEDMHEDLDPTDFGGTIPAVGDRFVQLLKGGCEGYRVVERIFDAGSHFKAVSLVVERTSTADIGHLPRFSSY
jgi:hypothetical protein